MNTVEKYQAQAKINPFIFRAICSNCYHDIFSHEQITDEVAQTKMITACPWCHKSFVD